MSDLTNLIADAVAAKMTPQFIDEVVNDRVSKLVVDSVDKALCKYSDTGKSIEKAVEEALRVDRIDLPQYGHVVAQSLKVQIEAKVADLVAGQLAKDMDELLSLAPKEVKLSEIAQQMLDRSSADYGECITVIVEPSSNGYHHIYLDEGAVYRRKDKYQCDHQISIDAEGKIYSARIDRKDLNSTQYVGRAYGLSQLIRAYVACGTQIILDEDDVCRGKGDY